MYKVTVLISLFKAAAYIESKIKSLQAQTIFQQSQIVLLNCQDLENESTLYAKFMREHENVMEIRYNHYIGLYRSWNDGINNTDSVFICNANCDDQWHPEYLERCVEFLETNSDYAVVSSRILITDIPNQLWPNWQSHDELPFHPYPLSTAGPCPVWRRSLHDKYGYFDDYFVIGDARLWEKWFAGGEKFGLIDDRLVLYYLSRESLERRRDTITGLTLRELDLKKQ